MEYAHPILGKKVGKLKLWPHISIMGGLGARMCSWGPYLREDSMLSSAKAIIMFDPMHNIGGLWVLQNKILASGPPVKEGAEKIVSVSKNFSETSHQIFTKIWRFLGSSIGYPVQNMEEIWRPNFWGGVEKLMYLNDVRR